MPLAWLGDVASLEERISRLECDKHQPTIGQSFIPPGARAAKAPESGHQDELHLRKSSCVSKNEPEGGLARSSPAIGLLATFARAEAENASPLHPHESIAKNANHQTDPVTILDPAHEQSLWDISGWSPSPVSISALGRASGCNKATNDVLDGLFYQYDLLDRSLIGEE